MATNEISPKEIEYIAAVMEDLKGLLTIQSDLDILSIKFEHWQTLRMHFSFKSQDLKRINGWVTGYEIEKLAKIVDALSMILHKRGLVVFGINLENFDRGRFEVIIDAAKPLTKT